MDQLYALYRKAERGELPYDFDFLLKYFSLDATVVTQVMAILLEKVKEDSSYAHTLSVLFNPYTEVNKTIIELFATNLDPLKKTYFAVLGTDQHIDYDGQTFGRILKLDPNFILEYIDQMYKGKEWLSRHDDTRDYSFLWMCNDYKEIMTRVVDRIYEQEQIRFPSTYLETFFRLRENDSNEAEITEKQDHFLTGLIERRHHDPDFIEFVFRVIAQFPPERRRLFVALFLQHNQTFEDFQRLRLEPNSQGWSGSKIPVLQKCMEYFEALLPLLNTVNLLQHKQYVEQRIQGLRSEIEQEKKRDFIKD